MLMSRSITHYPHLDTLRIFAAAAVALHHWLPELHLGHWKQAQYGVEVFFVISGFLITGILLSQKGRFPRWTIIRNFFVKRALRLFPAYYLLLIGLVVLNKLTGFWLWNDGNGIWFFTYTSNFLLFTEGFQSPTLNHTWTLAIEEQFYLVWPTVILFLPKRREQWLIGGLVIGSLLFKWIHHWFYSPEVNIRLLPFSHFDTLGLGALLAWWLHQHRDRAEALLQRFLPWMLPAAIVAYVACELTSWQTGIIFFLPVTGVLLVARGVEGFRGPAKFIFDNRALQYLGKISYGIYLFHKPIPHVIKPALLDFGIDYRDHPWLFLPIFAALTVLVAHFSWKLVEKPVLRLKDRFDLA